jgi:hypothetical protein
MKIQPMDVSMGEKGINPWCVWDDEKKWMNPND